MRRSDESDRASAASRWRGSSRRRCTCRPSAGDASRCCGEEREREVLGEGEDADEGRETHHLEDALDEREERKLRREREEWGPCCPWRCREHRRHHRERPRDPG